MLALTFDSFFFFIPYFWLAIISWVFFFFYNLSSVRIKQHSTNDKLRLKDLKLKESITFVFFDFVILNFIFLFFYFFILRGWACSFFFCNFIVSNSIIYILFIYFLFIFFLFFLLVSTGKLTLMYDFDFFFSLLNFFIVSTFFFMSKSFVSFFFFLELLSCFVFYQFIVSNTFYSKAKLSSVNSFGLKNNKQVLSVLFFQYWASFFSSVIFVYVFSLLVFFFGSTDWFILNFLFNFSLVNFMSLDLYIYFFVFFLFTFAFFIKLGLSPLQLFKIEIYKGLPFLSIFFYTTFYFFIFFLFFIFITVTYFTNIWLLAWYLIFFFLITGGIYILNLLFDTKFVKAFFAYSTIINTLGFLTLFLTILT